MPASHCYPWPDLSCFTPRVQTKSRLLHLALKCITFTVGKVITFNVKFVITIPIGITLSVNLYFTVGITFSVVITFSGNTRII